MFANVCKCLQIINLKSTKMNITRKVIVDYFFDKRRVKSNATYPLKLRLTFNRKTKYIPLGINLTESDHQKLMSGKRLTDQLADIRSRMEEARIKAINIIDKMNHFNFERFEIEFTGTEIIKAGDNQSINGLFEELMRTPNRKPSTIQIDLCALQSLNRYFKFSSNKQGINSHISVVTAELLKKWEHFLTNKDIKPKSIATVGAYARHIRIVMNMALEKGFIDEKQWPFGRKKFVVSASRSMKQVLTKEDMKNLLFLELDPITLECFSRDWFLLSYLCQGINLADLLELKNKDITNDGFSFYRVKVKDTSDSANKFIQVRFIDELKEHTLAIIQRQRSLNHNPNAYLFPYYNSSMSDEEKLIAKKNLVRRINQHLPKVAKLASLENEDISFGTARHTFASVLYDSGVSTLMISDFLGHSSTNTTNSYLHTLPGNPHEKALKNLI